MAKNTFHGIITYEILENGNILNGIYTNTDDTVNETFFIDNEIAQRTVTTENTTPGDIGGDYECRFIESSNKKKSTDCKLTIKKHGAVYKFDWQIGDKHIFNGIGIKIAGERIAVSYIDPSN